MNWSKILFWIGFVIVAWFGLRNLISIIIGTYQHGPLKSGQRSCHAIMIVLYWGSCVLAIIFHKWWILLIGVIVAQIFRQSVIKSGEVFSRENKDRDV